MATNPAAYPQPSSTRTRTGLLANRHDLARLTTAAKPAVEFVSMALKPNAVEAFVMDSDGGRIEIASRNVPPTLRGGDESDLDHGLLRAAASSGNRSLLLRSAHLGRTQRTEAYVRALGEHGFAEVGEFQFEDAGVFVGGITLFWEERAPALVEDEGFLRPLHGFVEFNFLNSWRRTAVGRRLVLSTFLDLTPRECDVVEMLCLGRTNQDAALCLGIRLPTVKTHLASLFDKFEVENRSALIHRALLSIDTMEGHGLTQ